MSKSKDAYYFPHDANARHDLKTSAMIAKYGMAGYGQYWVIIETLRESSNFEIENKPYSIDALAKEMQYTSEQAQCFINDCIEHYFLLQSDESKIWSDSLKRRMKIKDDIIEKRRQAAISRWSNSNALHLQSKCNAIKGKERKVNEIKKKNIFAPPQLDEIRKYISENNYSVDPEKFYNFYESKDWMIGKNKMKNWRAAIRTWVRGDRNSLNVGKNDAVATEPTLAEKIQHKKSLIDVYEANCKLNPGRWEKPLEALREELRELENGQEA